VRFEPKATVTLCPASAVVLASPVRTVIMLTERRPAAPCTACRTWLAQGLLTIGEGAGAGTAASWLYMRNKNNIIIIIRERLMKVSVRFEEK